MRAVLLFAVLSSVLGTNETCPAAGGAGGVNCTKTGESCCGAGTMFPSCLEADSGKKCCLHYLAAGQCSANSTCCGGGGPGASSYVFCCASGRTCCGGGGDGGALCCEEGGTCCYDYTNPWCCAKGTKCGVNGQCE